MARHRAVLPVFLWTLAAAGADWNGYSVQDFFDGNHLHDIRLTMDPADWIRLHENYADKKTNYRCTVEWRDICVENVGLHTRGSGSLNPIKPGMALEFAKFDAAQTFLGLQAVYLRNFAQDYSSLHERLTMRIFAQLGIPYQRAAHARLFVNGEYAGLYQTLEPLDNRFLLTRFGESKGYLYEGVGQKGFRFQDLGTNPAAYVPAVLDPKNNTGDGGAGASRIMEMVQAVNHAPAGEFEREAGRFLDLDAFVTLVAAETAVAEADGILSNGGMTNYYLYRRTGDDRFYFIIWDAEMTFNHPDFPIFENANDHVLLRRALEVPRLRQLYLDTIMQVSGILGGAGGWLEQELEFEFQQVRAALDADPNRVCLQDGVFSRCAPAAHVESYDWLRVFARNRSNFLLRSALDAGWMQNYQAPYLAPGAAHNQGSTNPFLTPRGLAEVHVILPSLAAEVRAASWPLPVELAGISVLLSGAPLPIVSAGPLGVVVSVPAGVVCGPAKLSVKVQGVETPPIPVEVRPANPSPQSVFRAGGHEVKPGSPAAGGEILFAWITGLGQSYGDAGREPPAGVGSGELIYTAQVYAGSVPARLMWAGVGPGVGLMELVIFQLPAQLPDAGASGALSLTVRVLDEPGTVFPLPVR